MAIMAHVVTFPCFDPPAHNSWNRATPSRAKISFWMAGLPLPALRFEIRFVVLLCVCVCARARVCVFACVCVCLRVCVHTLGSYFILFYQNSLFSLSVLQFSVFFFLSSITCQID